MSSLKSARHTDASLSLSKWTTAVGSDTGEKRRVEQEMIAGLPVFPPPSNFAIAWPETIEAPARADPVVVAHQVQRGNHQAGRTQTFHNPATWKPPVSRVELQERAGGLLPPMGSRCCALHRRATHREATRQDGERVIYFQIKPTSRTQEASPTHCPP